MDLQSKLIKALEETIELQKSLIAQQEAETQELELEISRLRRANTINELNKYPRDDTPRWEKYRWPQYPWSLGNEYPTYKVEDITFTDGSGTLHSISEPNSEKEKTKGFSS